MVSLPRIALSGSLPTHDFQFAFNSSDAVLNTAAVGFQLRFTFTTPHSDAAFLPGQVAPEPRQAGQQMLKLGEFDLELSLFRAGALGENIQDQRSPIQDFAVKHFFQIATLGRRKFVIKYDGIHIGAPAVLGEFIRLPFADESRGAGCNHTLRAVPDDLSSSGGGQFGKFIQ
jgi:hypothetical protein